MKFLCHLHYTRCIEGKTGCARANESDRPEPWNQRPDAWHMYLLSIDLETQGVSITANGLQWSLTMACCKMLWYHAGKDTRSAIASTPSLAAASKIYGCAPASRIVKTEILPVSATTLSANGCKETPRPVNVHRVIRRISVLLQDVAFPHLVFENKVIVYLHFFPENCRLRPIAKALQTLTPRLLLGRKPKT